MVIFENVGLTFKAGASVFRGLGFALKRGGRYALLGPNGAGKTSLARLLYGALRPDKGRVLVNGLEPWRQSCAVRAMMGILPENAPMLPELSPLDHLKLAARLRGLGRDEFGRECERLSDSLNLSSFLKRPTQALSIGQKRRAALAAAAVGGPDFFVLDEPSAGLDPSETRRLTRFLKELPTSATLLISTHILSEAYELTSDLILLSGGGLAAMGPWADFLAEAKGDPAALSELYLKLLKGAGR